MTGVGTAQLSPRAHRIIEALERVNEGVHGAARTAEVYDEDVSYCDPMHACRGKAALRAMTRRYIESARVFRYQIDRSSVVEGGDLLYFAFAGAFAGRVGPELRVKGLTQLRLRGDLIVSHQDTFDVLAAMLGGIPIVGRVHRWLPRREA